MSDTPPPERRELSSGDVVVVTGAARGIGRAIALRAAALGARVAILDINDGHETESLCTNAGGTACAGSAKFVCFTNFVSRARGA